jgi:hypothetical protein
MVVYAIQKGAHARTHARTHSLDQMHSPLVPIIFVVVAGNNNCKEHNCPHDNSQPLLLCA